VALRARDEGRLDPARRAVRKALRFDADYADAHLLQAELEAEKGHAAKAIAAWQRALDLAPERAPELHEEIAHALAAKGQRPLYEKMLRARLAEQADDAPTLLALARLLADAGQSEEAGSLLQDLTQREPGNVAAHVALGRLALAAGDPEDGADLVQRYGALLDALEGDHKSEEKV
jgi:lipopolysaccharide biosynthesis regulator YciM